MWEQQPHYSSTVILATVAATTTTTTNTKKNLQTLENRAKAGFVNSSYCPPLGIERTAHFDGTSGVWKYGGGHHPGTLDKTTQICTATTHDVIKNYSDSFSFQFWAHIFFTFHLHSWGRRVNETTNRQRHRKLSWFCFFQLGFIPRDSPVASTRGRFSPERHIGKSMRWQLMLWCSLDRKIQFHFSITGVGLL